jgi:hypothetical protein
MQMVAKEEKAESAPKKSPQFDEFYVTVPPVPWLVGFGGQCHRCHPASVANMTVPCLIGTCTIFLSLECWKSLEGLEEKEERWHGSTGRACDMSRHSHSCPSIGM